MSTCGTANFNQAEFRAEYQGNKVEFAKIDELALGKVVGKIFTVIQVINRFILSKNNKYFYNGKKWAMLSAKKLGEFTGLSGRTVYRHLNKLQEMGIIIADKIFSLKNSKRNQTNFYTINYQKLEELGVPLYKKFSVTIDDF